MSYSDFNLPTLRRVFGIRTRDLPIFEQIGSVEPSAWLTESFGLGQDYAVTSEKARSEFIVAPVLMSCRYLLGHDFRIFSGARLDIDPERGLKGECDFILGRSASTLVLEAPLMILLEAKKHDIEDGIGQCGAQMIGASLYNEREGKAVPFVYGCVTNGNAWQFLKLQGDELLVHTELLPLQELRKILWFLVECVRDVDRMAVAIAG